jgi:hypothetical protein
MPPPDPEDLLEQADCLTVAKGAPRQTDLRRAISAAYYGVFHFTLTAAADMVVGAGSRSTSLYSLAYRSVDHARLRTLCRQLNETRIRSDLLPYAPEGGFGGLPTLHEWLLNCMSCEAKRTTIRRGAFRSMMRGPLSQMRARRSNGLRQEMRSSAEHF